VGKARNAELGFARNPRHCMARNTRTAGVTSPTTGISGKSPDIVLLS
jgi:hypothetical protein